jgi:Mg2+ and Co2+ transporter CorA
MANILQLSFHLVTQRDSQSMKTIAVMTLLFMPLGTVAAIFGTQLIKLKDEKPYHMELSRDFWLIFAISMPLTIFVVVTWRLWYRDTKTKVKERSTGYWRLGGFKERFDRARIGQKTVGHTV